MKPNYSISISKPCHQDWSKMTLNEKGRFCKSCSKIVVDFTKMNVEEIQNYIHINKKQRICGHIKQSQLDSINLKIPETVFKKTCGFHGLFLLALLLVMGTTLLNCSDDNGKRQRINSVEIVKTHQKSADTILNGKKIKEIDQDSITKKRTIDLKTKIIEQHLLDGMIEIETVGDIEILPNNIDDVEPIEIDSLEIEAPPFCPGPEDGVVFGILTVENPPEFNDTPGNLSKSEKRKYLSKQITEIINKNFNTDIAKIIGVKGKQKIYTQFKIDEKGSVKNIKVRSSSNSELEEEAIRVIKLLPKFKPATQDDKNIEIVYTLPIIFIAED